MVMVGRGERFILQNSFIMIYSKNKKVVVFFLCLFVPSSIFVQTCQWGIAMLVTSSLRQPTPLALVMKSPNGARSRSPRSPLQPEDSQLLSPMRPVAHSDAMKSPTGDCPRSSRSPLQHEDSQLPSPMRPVAHSDAMKSPTGVGSPERRVRVRTPSGSPERPGLYYSPMRPVAHDDNSPLPAKTIKINIKTQAGQTITMEVEEGDTINQVKDSLDWHHGVNGCRGKKLMQDCGELSDMWQLNIKDGDTLHLVDPPPSDRKIFVKTPTGKSYTVEVDVSDTMENLKHKIAKIEGVDVTGLALHLEDGQNFCDYITPSGVYIVYMLPAYTMPRTPPRDSGCV